MLSEKDLKRILPTMTGHINFIGQFDLDFNRKPPFKLSQLVGYCNMVKLTKELFFYPMFSIVSIFSSVRLRWQQKVITISNFYI